MESEKLRIVVGRPKDIKRTVTSNTVREQWVYGDIGNIRYYYFKNVVLTSWQN